MLPHMANGGVRPSAGIHNQTLTERGHAYYVEILTSPLLSRVGTHLQRMWD